MMGDCIPEMPMDRESYYLTIDKYRPIPGKRKDMPFNPIMMEAGIEGNTNYIEEVEE